MDAMDIARIIMWAISGLLIPALAYAYKRIRDLELKMETRISHQDAAKMIKDSTDKMDRRFDKLEDLILEAIKGK